MEDWASGFVTTTSTRPRACGGATTTMEVAVCAETVAAVPPNRTETGETKPVPASVTAVPPTPAPDAGDRLERSGAGVAGGVTNENAPASTALCPVRVRHGCDGCGHRRRGRAGDRRSVCARHVLPWPSGLVTVTGCEPAPCAGVETTSDVAVRLVTVAATPPKVTTLPAAPGTKPLPARVTDGAAAEEPEAGGHAGEDGGDAAG